MKHYATLLICIWLTAVSNTSIAQASTIKERIPKWMSNKGFWVIESNIATPKQAIVYFYNNDKTLVYKEAITAVRININRKKVCKRLEAVLTQTVEDFEKEKVLKENNQLVLNALHH